MTVMRITIIYDDTIFRKDLQADWGFSVLVKAKKRKILFDTEANGSILSNLEKLKINPEEIEDIFISHPHRDHVGGLSAILRLNNQLKLWVPFNLFQAENAGKIVK